MKSQIHPTAIIEKGAVLGANVSIGPYAVVGPHVKLGDNVVLHSHAVVAGHTTVGEGTAIYPFASIGHPPQDLKYAGEPSELIIGRNNTIREHVTMNPGTESGGMKTIVGDNNLFMMASHVAHDCRIGNNVIMANNASLGGHVVIGDFAVLGGMCGVHQFVRIGEYAVVGGMTGVDNDVIPFGRVKGERAHLAGLNLVGLERRGFSKDDIRTLQKAFDCLFAEEGTLEKRLQKLEQDFGKEELVMDVVRFAREKTRFPLCQPPRKAA
jgi:UDP-N-acetylglucosamine acyltransferase